MKVTLEITQVVEFLGCHTLCATLTDMIHGTGLKKNLMLLWSISRKLGWPKNCALGHNVPKNFTYYGVISYYTNVALFLNCVCRNCIRIMYFNFIIVFLSPIICYKMSFSIVWRVYYTFQTMLMELSIVLWGENGSVVTFNYVFVFFVRLDWHRFLL